VTGEKPVKKEISMTPEPVVLSLGQGRPTLTVLGGVHGDEFEGQVAVRILTRRLADMRLTGTVRLVAAANPLACRTRTRTTAEDGRNLAREFPGDPNGSPTQRIAAALVEKAIVGADLLVDLHSAGSTFDMPLFAGIWAGDAEIAPRAGRGFGAPLLWLHSDYAPGRSISAARDLGIPTLYVEGSGGGGLRGAEVDVYVDGVLRLAHELGILATAPAPAPPPRIIRGGDGDLDNATLAELDGWCVTRSRAGAEVTAGDLLAEIVRDDGTVGQQVRADSGGIVALLRRHAPVRTGDTVAMLASWDSRD
jgi:predicted deacylase